MKYALTVVAILIGMQSSVAQLLTPTEKELLTDIHRKMDSGQVPFVVYEGERWAAYPSTMEHLKLVSGQTVDAYVITEVLRFNMLAAERAQAKMKHDLGI